MSEDLSPFFADFGEPVILFPGADNESQAVCLFGNGFLAVETAPARVSLASANPTITMASADADDLRQGDPLSVRGVTYAVNTPQPDGTGLTILELLEA